MITAGGLIAAACCYIPYKSLLDRKKNAISELQEQILTSDQSMPQSLAGNINIKESILTLAIAMAVLGVIVYLLQSFI